MGGTQPTGAPKRNGPPISKIEFETKVQTAYYQLEIHRDKKIHDLQKKESKLKETIKNNVHSGQSEAIAMEASNCIGALQQIKGANMILNQLKQLKEHSMEFTAYLNGQPAHNIEQLQPYLLAIIWSTTRLNNQELQNLSNFIAAYVGQGIFQAAEVSPIVDLNLKRILSQAHASPLEIQDYLDSFCKRSELDPMLVCNLWAGTSNPANNGGGFDINVFMGAQKTGSETSQPGQLPPRTGSFGGPAFPQPPVTGHMGTSNPFGSASAVGDLNQRLAELRRVGA